MQQEHEATEETEREEKDSTMKPLLKQDHHSVFQFDCAWKPVHAITFSVLSVPSCLRNCSGLCGEHPIARSHCEA